MSERRLASRRALGVCGILVTCAGALAACSGYEAQASARLSAPRDSALLQRMFDAEDSRATDSALLTPLYEGLRSSDAAVRRVAARAFGRLERRSGLGALRSVLGDSSPEVRVEAVNAIAQIVNGEVQRARAAGDSGDGDRLVTEAVSVLTDAVAAETDQGVRDAIARSLARLPYRTPGAAVSALSGLLHSGPQDTSAGRNESFEPPSLSSFGRAYALDALVRRNPVLRTEPAIVRAVANLADAGNSVSAGGGSAAGWTREARVLRASVRGRMLTAAALTSGGSDVGQAVRAIQQAFIADFRDEDPQVRRQVISLAASAAALDDSARTRLVDAALRDTSFHVRVEAVRAYVRRPNASCASLVAATADANPHVALTAIDMMATMASCREQSVADRLVELVRTIPPREPARRAGQGSWHAGAHALVALARLDAERARPIVNELSAHPVWQVRMYAGTAAGVIADTSTLGRLAKDSVDNVRDAAVNTFAGLVRPGPGGAPPRIARTAAIDSIFVAQLARTDYQLVVDAARALEGVPASGHTVDALFAALDRITAERSETSRDPRMELLARLQTLASADQRSRLTPYLNDFDPAVAERAATILRGWGLADAVATPQPLSPISVSLRDVARLANTRVRVTMAPTSGGGTFELRLFVEDAPATVARFVSLARRGYYDNLTFHRVATNFVIQGGSPGANEYAGHDRYMRDELGLRSHARGTLGISTRGRDTGDAQIFVNLIDNFRLDHDYTVFADVTRGMNVVDGILEGAVIARVEVLGAR